MLIVRKLVLVGLAAIWACSIGLEPIDFGRDQCAFCKMTISDTRYGGELITDKGRILKYDAIECMINHLNSDAPDYSALYAIAFDRPEKLYNVDSLQFVISPEFSSPMGANLAAILNYRSDKNLKQEEFMSWNHIVDVFRKKN